MSENCLMSLYVGYRGPCLPGQISEEELAK